MVGLVLSDTDKDWKPLDALRLDDATCDDENADDVDGEVEWTPPTAPESSEDSTSFRSGLVVSWRVF